MGRRWPLVSETSPVQSRGPAAYKGTRPGGRSARVREAVLAATAIEVSEVGYAELSLARVAERAGVAPTTVRRRWGHPRPARRRPVRRAGVTAPRIPSSTRWRPICARFAAAVAGALGDVAVQRLLRGMLALPTDDLGPIQREYWTARVAVADGIVARAIERGEVPEGTSGWSVVEPVLAPIWMGG